LATAQTVTVSASASSLPLTLKSRPVEEAVRGYIKALRRIPEGGSDVTGLVFGVNGEINSADIYSSPELFAAMWPKLLKASAVEAVRLKRKEPSPAVQAAAAVDFLQAAETGAESRIEVDGHLPPAGPYLLFVTGNLPAGMISEVLAPRRGERRHRPQLDAVWVLVYEAAAFLCWYGIGVYLESHRRTAIVLLACLVVRFLLALNLVELQSATQVQMKSFRPLALMLKLTLADFRFTMRPWG
jgi:hypothetical protein